jgi:hypothetical protein
MPGCCTDAASALILHAATTYFHELRQLPISDKSRFALPEASVGLIPGGGGTQRLARLIGTSRSLYMLTGCDDIDASRNVVERRRIELPTFALRTTNISLSFFINQLLAVLAAIHYQAHSRASNDTPLNACHGSGTLVTSLER